jgi:uncharacterized phiE125 gp8 family phage protein
MVYAARVVTPPAIEPVTLADASKHLRLLSGANDELLTTYIAAARRYIEDYSNLVCIDTVFDWQMDAFPNGCFKLPRYPLQSVASIKYLDDVGVEQTLATDQYRVVKSSIRGFVSPAFNTSWPVTQGVPAAITVRFTAGHGTTAASVEPALKHAILLMVANMFENRSPVIIGSISKEIELALDSLVNSVRIMQV